MDIKKFVLDNPVYRWNDELEMSVKVSEPTLNERDNTIYRGYHSTNRYYFDSKLIHGMGSFGNWEQYDTEQDAWYFGVWVSTKLNLIFTYAEGDISLVECKDLEHLRAELKQMAEFYGPPPPAFIVIDVEKGTREDIICARPEV